MAGDYAASVGTPNTLIPPHDPSVSPPPAPGPASSCRNSSGSTACRGCPSPPPPETADATASTPGAPPLAWTFIHASWTAHFEISNGLSGDFNSFTRLLPNPNGFRLIERIQPQMTRPLRSTPITGASPLLRAGPPAEPATVLTPMQRTGFSLSPARKPERAVSHPAFSRSMQKPQTGLASPPCRTPPGPSAGTRQARPGIRKTPRFRCHLFLFRHVNSESLALAFPIPT